MDRQAQKSVLGVVLLLVVTAGMVALSVRFGGWADGRGSTSAEGEAFPVVVLSGRSEGGIAGKGGPGTTAVAVATSLPLSLRQSEPGPAARASTPSPSPLPSPPSSLRLSSSSPLPSAPTGTSSPAVPPTTVPGAALPESVAPSITASSAPPSTVLVTADGTLEAGPPPDQAPPADPGEQPLPPPTASPPPVPVPVPLSAVEMEIVRLTNELRTEPNGRLRREGPLIDCGGRIPVDWTTGSYLAVAPVTVDPEASRLVARPWAAQLTTDLHHRPRAGVTALEEAGIAVWVAGENIAYHNYPDTAFRHFVGWRESDGHFCNLMDPQFTHLGVGEVTRQDGLSYAAQNFFSLQ